MNAPSLAGFLEITEARYRLFDLGTQLKRLPANTLQALDGGEPYPHPHLGFGWMVIFLWNDDLSEQNSLWFLKLPLDEQGILPAAVHSDLVNRLYKALQTTDAKERQRLLTDHPYQFKPEDGKMAALHAQATKILGLPASDYLPQVKDFYLNGNSAIDWTQLGLQGIADLACRAKDDELKQLAASIADLAVEPQMALLAQLEHISLPTPAVVTLQALVQRPDVETPLKVAILRAAANSPAYRLMEPTLRQELSLETANMDMVLLILTRYASLCEDTELAALALDRLARQADADGFARVVTNLAMQPGLQGIVMRILGSSYLTETLGHALGRLIQQQRSSHERH